MIAKKIIFFILFTTFIHCGIAQNDTIRMDTTKVTAKNKKAVYSTAKRATIMSIVLPGLGQVYNKKWWKVPIIYAGIGGFGYMFLKNDNQYRFYRKNLIAVYDGDENTVNTTDYTGDQLLIQKVYYKKYRDFGIIGVGIFYLLNIVDANVDGHLKTFDVSDNLSINVDPWHSINLNGRSASGLSIKINFK